MAEIVDRMDVLEALLRAPLQVTHARRQSFPARWHVADAVIATHRFIILEAGEMDYTVEGRRSRLGAGTQFFVPAWCRREWRVPRGAGGCRLSWCEFSSGTTDVPPVLCWRMPAAAKFELRAFRSVFSAAGGGRSACLKAEGELKACLGRFWTEAQSGARVAERKAAVHAEVARAVAWLQRHYREPDALERFYETVTLSPNHFRWLFRKETGETVQAVLARLRMRQARYLVRETNLPMKRIAGEAGFADPLYFSNQYRKFWGRAATRDRTGSGMA